MYLAGAGPAEAAEVAERIRERTETAIIPLRPGAASAEPSLARRTRANAG